MEKPVFDDVKVKLTGKDGNAFFILGTVQRAIEQKHPGESKAFLEEAKAGDYDHLLRTCMKYVHVS
mgnify:CR=1 FL=1